MALEGAEATMEDADRVQRVLVLADGRKQSAQALCERLVPWLEERVPHVHRISDPQAFAAEGLDGETAGGMERPDLVVVLGGDGALLGAARALADDPVPTLGINLGRVGFLASTPASRWEETLEGVLQGQGVLERRMRLRATWECEGSCGEAIVLNEVCVQRSSQQGMLGVSLSVGGIWVTEYRADGVIVASPSGSTAYSLSAGGPILEPSVFGVVITPISPQGLSTRPLVVHADQELILSHNGSSGTAMLALDGQCFHPLEEGTIVRVRRHETPFLMYAMPGLDPYRRLRNRLGWGGDVPRLPEGDHGN